MQRHQGYELLERIGSLLRAELRKSGAEYGLQPAHLQALGFFAQANRYSNTPAALTEYLGVTKGTASQTLLVLENLGLVKKTEDICDRRVVRVELTRRGRSILAALAPPELWGATCAKLGKRDLDDLAGRLEQVLRVMQQVNGTRTFGVCRTCRHFLSEGASKFRCGLTREPLKAEESLKICREHEAAPAA
ncbi:MAG: MarR family transcriptional regulator [Gammaproteobacteria bacterium]|nr:MAG: MarR family transcriptional regulator [Gammaproteobacteria bacterium]